MNKPILYTLNCPICKVVKQKLDDANIEYEVCTDTDKMASLGIDTLPVLSVDGKLLHAKQIYEYIREYEVRK